MSCSMACFISGVIDMCSSVGCAGLDFDGMQAAVFEGLAERGVDEPISVEQRHAGKRAGHHGEIVMVERARTVVRLDDCVGQLFPDERLDRLVSYHSFD